MPRPQKEQQMSDTKSRSFVPLSTSHPHLAKQISVNSHISADELHAGTSSTKPLWVCPDCDYEWEASVPNRIRIGLACPRCAGRVATPGVNDLQTLHPDIAMQLDPKCKIPASELLPYSNKRLVWRCVGCGAKWKMTVAARQNSRKCPTCGKRGDEAEPPQWIPLESL